MAREVVFDDEWTPDREKKFLERQSYFVEVMNGSCWTEDNGFNLFEGNAVLTRMEEVFDAAQEVVYINGKPSLVYRDFDHYLEIYLQNRRQKQKP